MQLADITIIASLFNFLSMVGNLIWSWRLNSIKGNNELVNYWKGECDKKDNELKEYRHQYNHQLALSKRLEGELNAYNHTHRIEHNSTN